MTDSSHSDLFAEFRRIAFRSAPDPRAEEILGRIEEQLQTAERERGECLERGKTLQSLYAESEEQLETMQRERDTLDTAIAEYAEASGMLIHSWPDDERERQRQSLYADTTFMQGALDAQADSIAALKGERDWWRERYLLDVTPDAGQVARLDYEAAEFVDSSPAASLPPTPASSLAKAEGGWCEKHGGYLGRRCATCALESAPASEPRTIRYGTNLPRSIRVVPAPASEPDAQKGGTDA